jgi:hypothetical protein
MKEINFKTGSERFWADWHYEVVQRFKHGRARVQNTLGGISELVVRVSPTRQIRVPMPKSIVDLALKARCETLWIYSKKIGKHKVYIIESEDGTSRGEVEY